MTAEQQRVVRWCVETEIAVTEQAIKASPKRDYYGQPNGDVRVRHLSLLREALYEVNRIKVAGP